MKKRSRVIGIILLAICTLSVSASAYYASVVATHSFTPLSGYPSSGSVFGYSTITANASSGLSEMCAQATIYDSADNSLVYGVNTVPTPTTDTIKATAVAKKSSMIVGEQYYVHAYGHIKYMTRYGEEKEYYTDEDYFVLPKDRTVSTSEPEPPSAELRYAYNQTRAEYLLEQFGISPEPYTFARDYELLEYVETDQYIFIQDVLHVKPVITASSFFVGGDTIYGVCQDQDAVNHLFEFAKSDDGTWALKDSQELQDTGRYEDVHQSFAEFETAALANQ